MKTMIATTLLSIMFLSAGAFAGDRHAITIPAAAVSPKAENVTVVFKNQAWPQAGLISVEPCKYERCYDI